MSENGTAVLLARPLVEHSESLAQVATALAAAQGEMANAPENARGNFGTYADLAAVLDVARPVLSRHGLSVAQFPSAEGKRVTVTTLLLHKSGEWLRGELSVDAKDGGAQSVGSAITYCRRYSYMAVAGIAPEEDDGAAAQPVQQKVPTVRSAITTPEVDALATVCAEKGYTVAYQCRVRFEKENVRDLTRAEYEELLGAMRNAPVSKKKLAAEKAALEKSAAEKESAHA